MVVSSGRGCPLSMRPCAGKGAAFFRTFHRSPHAEREGYAAEVGREDWADCLSVWDFLDTRGSAGQDRQTQADAYSGGTIDNYPPVIQELKFEPGRMRGRKV